MKCANTISPIAPFGEQRAQPHRQRLVVIVLADQHDAPGGVARGGDRAVVLHARERRLLDEHVLARGERLQRQVEMEPRRHRDDHGVDARVGDGRRVVSEAGEARRTGRGTRSARAASRLA